MKVGWSQFVESQRKPSALTPRPLASQLVHEHKDNLDVDAAVGTLHRLDCKFVHLWVSCGGSHQLRRQSKSWSEQSISIKAPLIATINKMEAINKFTVYCFLSGGAEKRGMPPSNWRKCMCLHGMSAEGIYTLYIWLLEMFILLTTRLWMWISFYLKPQIALAEACTFSFEAYVKEIAWDFWSVFGFSSYKFRKGRTVLKLSWHISAYPNVFQGPPPTCIFFIFFHPFQQ